MARSLGISAIHETIIRIKETERYIPDFQSDIIDLLRLNDEVFGDQVELKAFLMALKYSRSSVIFKVLPEIIRSFNSLGKCDDDYLREVLLYIGSLIDKSKISEFLEIIEREHIDGVSYMETIADALAEEGRKQKRKKTQQIVAELRKEIQKNKAALREEKQKEFVLLHEVKDAIVKQLLQKKMSIEFIRETTGLTRKRIEEIKKKMG